jgi:hypothetical protein
MRSLTFELSGPQRQGALPRRRRIAAARLLGKAPCLGGSALERRVRLRTRPVAHREDLGRRRSVSIFQPAEGQADELRAQSATFEAGARREASRSDSLLRGDRRVVDSAAQALRPKGVI